MLLSLLGPCGVPQCHKITYFVFQWETMDKWLHLSASLGNGGSDWTPLTGEPEDRVSHGPGELTANNQGCHVSSLNLPLIPPSLTSPGVLPGAVNSPRRQLGIQIDNSHHGREGSSVFWESIKRALMQGNPKEEVRGRGSVLGGRGRGRWEVRPGGESSQCLCMWIFADLCKDI